MHRAYHAAETKKLILHTARISALGFVALAASVNAHAATFTLPISSLDCFTNSSDNCSAGVGATQLPTLNGVDGVKMYTNGPVDIWSTNASLPHILTLEIAGTPTGSSTGFTMPVAYNFTITGSATGGDFSGTTWSLTMSVEDFFGTGCGCSGTFKANGSGIGTFSGAGTLSSPLIASGDLVVILGDIVVTPGAHVTDLSVNVPQSSLDFNAVPTPEPATAGLAALAFAAMGRVLLCRRR